MWKNEEKNNRQDKYAHAQPMAFSDLHRTQVIVHLEHKPLTDCTEYKPLIRAVIFVEPIRRCRGKVIQSSSSFTSIMFFHMPACPFSHPICMRTLLLINPRRVVQCFLFTLRKRNFFLTLFLSALILACACVIVLALWRLIRKLKDKQKCILAIVEACVWFNDQNRAHFFTR